MTAATQPSVVPRIWIAALLVLATSLCVVHWQTFYWLKERYTAASSYYSHGPLIPLISAFLLWRDRKTLKSVPRSPTWRGLWLFLPALLFGLAGAALRIDSIAGFGLFLTLPGLVWLLGGSALLRHCWFPLVFLGFALPLPMFFLFRLANLLKGLIVHSAVTVTGMLGLGIEASGSYLILPEQAGRLLVDDECCGLRSLVALIALGALMAGTSRGSPGFRWALLLLAVPIAVAANLTRVIGLILTAVWGGVERARDWHDPSGYAVYALAIVVYVALERWAGRTRTSFPGAAS